MTEVKTAQCEFVRTRIEIGNGLALVVHKSGSIQFTPTTDRNFYGNGKCRCAVCREANARYQKLLCARLSTMTPRVHGKASTYRNWGCRCQPCTEANKIAGRKYKSKK